MNKILLIIIFFSSWCASAQETFRITKINDSEYHYKDRIDKLHNLEALFQDDEQSKMLFTKFNKARKSQRTANILFPSTVVLSTILLSSSPSVCAEGCGDGAILAAPYLLGGVYALLANFGFGAEKAKNKKALLRRINQRSDLGMKTVPSFNLIMGANGAGVAYTF